MNTEIPADVRRLLDQKRHQDELERQTARKRERAAAREEARLRRLKRPLARRLLEFARALAREPLPARGVEISFVAAGRSSTRTIVMPDGRIEQHCIVAPFGGGMKVARRERDLLDVPLKELEQLAGAIESGEVWSHVRRSTAGR